MFDFDHTLNLQVWSSFPHCQIIFKSTSENLTEFNKQIFAENKIFLSPEEFFVQLEAFYFFNLLLYIQIFCYPVWTSFLFLLYLLVKAFKNIQSFQTLLIDFPKWKKQILSSLFDAIHHRFLRPKLEVNRLLFFTIRSISVFSLKTLQKKVTKIFFC